MFSTLTKKMKRFFKSKTVSFGLLLVILSAVQQYLPELQVLLKDYYSIATFVIGVAVIVLRYLTTTPMSDK